VREICFFIFFVSSYTVGPAAALGPARSRRVGFPVGFGWGTKEHVHKHFSSVKIFDDKDGTLFRYSNKCTISLK
jgi:hypothetical protein